MATAPVTPSAPKLNKVETFFTKFGDVLKAITNAGVKVSLQELPVVNPLLPPNIATQVTTLVNAAAQQVAAADAKYTIIGASDVPFAIKVAEAVAVGGQGVLAMANEAGLTIANGQLATFFAASAQIAATLNLAGVTAAPVVAAPAPAPAPVVAAPVAPAVSGPGVGQA